MKDKEVPQDAERSTYGGHKKLLYAIDEKGGYTSVQSAGWEAESTVTRAVIEDIERQSEEVWQQVNAGEVSVLKYYMLVRRMDEALLAQTSGIWKWRIRRHFRPRNYSQLSDAVIQRYADALGYSVAELRQLPETPLHGN